MLPEQMKEIEPGVCNLESLDEEPLCRDLNLLTEGAGNGRNITVIEVFGDKEGRSFLTRAELFLSEKHSKVLCKHTDVFIVWTYCF